MRKISLVTRSLEEIRKEIIDFSEAVKRDREHLYFTLCNIILQNKDLMDLSLKISKKQPVSHIFLGSVHYLLLQGNSHKLSEYFPTLNQEGNVREVDDKLETVFVEFVKQYQDQLIQLFETKRVQTNEIGRSAFLLPGMRYLSNIVNKPITLIELGTSAGLLLNFDKYEIVYSSSSKTVKDYDPSKQILCEVRGEKNPPNGELPVITNRIGIDLEPIHCMNDEEAKWLQAMIWPNNVSRFNLLQHALNICRENKSDIKLVRGDAFGDITDYLMKFNNTETATCIYHSFAINQIPEEEKTNYYNKLKSYSKSIASPIYELRVHWNMNHGTRLLLNIFRDGIIETHELAKIHYHGKWIEWLE